MTTKSTSSSSSSTSPLRLPKWMWSWLVVSSTLVLYDVGFVLTRPASFTGGSLHWLFFPYDSYLRYDPVYSDVHDAFGIAQSYINLLELALILAALLLARALPSSSTPHLLVLIATSSTLFKTLLYIVHEAVGAAGHGKGRSGYSLLHLGTWDVGYVGASVVPILAWVVFPVAVLVSLGRQFVAAADASIKGKRA